MQTTKIPTPTKKYALTLIQPDHYAHSAALGELAETLIYGFHALGLALEFNINTVLPERVNIVLGAHLLDAAALENLPDDCIIYNSEQSDAKSTWMTEDYLKLLRRLEVWDYSAENVRRLRLQNITRIKYVPVGYVPQLTRLPLVAQDIDVLFYGAINERRKNILEALIAQGLRVEFLSGMYREDRDHYIARAKIVLNMHYYEASIFEVVRVSYLLSNEKAVVSECNVTTAMDIALHDALCGAPYDKLVASCVALIQNDDQRNKLAKQGFDLFSAITEEDILRRALELPAPAATQKPLPRNFHLGSGKNWKDDFFNVDIKADVRPDALLDISDPQLFERTFTTQRFGEVSLRPNMFDTLLASHVLEHIRDLQTAMTNCLTLLKPGGIFTIEVPYDLSYGAWQDPTHVRAFNERSWNYYTDWYWYMGWSEARFDVLNLTFGPSTLGQQLSAQGKSFDEILRTPRAIDVIRVALRKRYLLESEVHKMQQETQRSWD